MIELTLGPPGTGKTTWLLDEVTRREPQALAYCAFTKRAAEEARGRIKGKRSPREFRTIHSLAFAQLGLREGNVLSWSDWEAMGKLLNIRFNKYFDAEEAAMGDSKGDRLRAIVDYAAAACQPVQDVWQAWGSDIDEWQLKRFVETLAAYKKDTGKLDFNDMLLKVPANCDPLKLDLAVIDEAQDLSQLQWRVVNHFFKKVKHRLIAGDDDQAIFRWAGADVETFLGLDAKRRVLDVSHRLPQAVYAQAQKIVSQIKHRYDKTWSPRKADGQVETLSQIEDVVLGEGSVLLLARNGYLLRDWEDFCRAKGVHYARKGRAGAKPEHLRSIRAWEKFRKTGEFDDDDLSGYVRDRKDKRVWFEALNLPANDVAYYRAALARGAKLEGEPRIRIETIHGAKGSEADHVCLMTDRSARTDQSAMLSPDDEHRVFYVGVTRARDRLTIIRPRGLHAYAINP